MPKPLAVLNIEDSESDSDLIARLLKKAGYKITFERVETGAQMRAALKKRAWDIIISDHSLPQFDSYAALALLHEEELDIPFIVISGTIGEEAVVDMMKAGAHDFLIKDNLTRLVPAMERELEYAKVRREHKLVENALHASEKRFRALIENGLDDISLLTADGTLIWESPSVVRNLDYTPEEFIGHNIFELMHPDDLEPIQNLFAEVVQKPAGQQAGAFRLKRSDGTWRWVEATATNMLDEPSVQAIVINYRDITERKQAEEALKKAGSDYQRLFDHANDVIIIFEPEEEIILEANLAACAIYGFSRDELIGMSLKKLTEDVAQGEAQISRTLSSGAYHDFESVHTNKNGQRIYFLINASVIEYQGKKAILSLNHNITERKRAEDALRASESSLQGILQSTADGILAIDMENKVLFSNEHFAEMWKIPKEVISNKDDTLLLQHVLDQLTHPQDFLNQVQELYKSNQESLDILHFKDGRVFERSSKPIMDGKSSVGRVWSFRDITERKRSEESLRESEQRFQSLFDRMLDGVYRSRHAGRFVDVNPAMVKMFGYSSRAEMLAVDIKNELYFDPAERGSHILDTGLEETDVYRMRRKDGSEIWVEDHGSYIHDEQGRIIFHEGILRDITERRSAEEKLYLQRAALEAVANTIVITDKQGLIQWANPSFKELTGYDATEAEGRNPRELVKSGRQNKAFYKNLWDTILSGKVWRGELVNRRKDGSLYAEEMTITPLHSQSGEISSFIAIKQDISERKQAEEGLHESEARYRSLFDDSPMALWEEDFSAVKLRLDALRAEGIKDFRAYFALHPEVVLECISLVKIVDVNKAALKLFGTKVKADLLQNLGRFIDADSAQSFQNELISIAQGKTQFEWEGVNQTVDGRQIIIRLSLSVIPGYEDTFSKVIISMVDITASIQAEQAIRESEKSLRESQLIAGLGSYTLDIPSENWTSSDILNQIFGIDESYAHSIENWTALIHPDWRKEMSDYLANEVLVNHIRFDKEYKIVRKNDGAQRWIHGLGELEFDSNNQPVKMRGTIQDITERKQAEIEIKERTDDLELINSLNEAVNRDESLDVIIRLFAKTLSPGNQATFYLFSPDGSQLVMQNLDRSQSSIKKIEQLIGRPIPQIQIPITEGGYFHHALYAEHGLLITDPKAIQSWMGEFTETNYLPSAIRGTIRKLVPQIYKLLNIRSAITIPLVSDKKVIGLLDVSSADILTEKDLNRIRNISGPLTAVILRKQAEDELLSARELLQSVQDALAAHISILDHDGNIVQVNSGWHNFGARNGLAHPNHCIGMNYLDVCDSAKGVNAREAPLVANAIRSVLNGEKNEAWVEYPCHAPHDQRWFIARITSFENNGQRWVVVSHENITERKQAEESLSQSEALYRQAMEVAGAVPYYETYYGGDKQKIKYDFIGEGIRQITGYGPEEFNGALWDELVEEANPVEELSGYSLEDGIQRVRTGEIPIWKCEFRIRDRFGKTHWVFEAAVELRDENGVSHGSIGTYQDITARKQAEQALREGEQRYRALFEDMPISIWEQDFSEAKQYLDSLKEQGVTDMRMYFEHNPEAFLESATMIKVLDVNRATLKMYHADSKQDLYKSMDDGLNESEVEHILDALIAISEGKLSHGWEGANQTVTGERIEVSLSWNVAPGHEVDFARVIVTTIDITERKKAEAQIKYQLSELEALYENGLAISRLLEPKRIAQRMVEVIDQKLEWHHAAVRLYDASTDRIELLALNLPGFDEAQIASQIERINQAINTSDKGLSGWVIGHGEVVRVGKLKDDPRYLETYPGINSGLYVPIRSGDEVIGSIAVESEMENAFTERDAHTLATLANQAAIAFVNARLYVWLQKELDERLQAEEQVRRLNVELEQRVAERTALIEATKRRLELATHAGQIGVWEYNPRENKVIWDERMHMIHQIPKGEFDGTSQSWAQLIHPHDIEQSQINRELAVTKNLLMNNEHRIFWPDGSIRHIMSSAVTAYSPDGKPDRIIGINMDITERKQTEQSLRESENYARLLFDAVADPVSVTEGDGSIVDVNEAFEKQYNLVRDEIRGKRISELGIYPESELDKRQKYLSEILQGQPGKPVELDYYAPGDRIHTLELYSYPLKINDRQLMLNSAHDITLHKKAEETQRIAKSEMERALRIKNEFLANMSHELRTPLNAILGISESLEEQIAGTLNEKQLKYIGIVRESGRHLLELINDILDLSKIEAGRMELDIHKFSVEILCQSSLRMIKELSQKKNLHVSFAITGDIKIIRADQRRLKQSLVNLLSNAVKFTQSGKEIGLEVSGNAEKNEVDFTVWDQGLGIAEEKIKLLFKPFVQLDAGLAREYQGTGLGLALVAQMINLHGGRVSVKSEVGQGSRFTITLPWSPKEQTPKAKVTAELSLPSPRSDVKRSGRLLLVEDTDVVVQLTSDYLKYKGYEIIIAQNGVEAIKLAAQERPDLILMDVMMPIMDGLEATRRIRANKDLANIPIIALTALAMPGDSEQCLAAGMTDYLSKPLQMQDLADMIEKHMRPTRKESNEQ